MHSPLNITKSWNKATDSYTGIDVCTQGGRDAPVYTCFWKPVKYGQPRTYSRGAPVGDPCPADGPYAANQCDLNGISELDNVTFVPGYDSLIIGEDTGQHQNDMIWAYQSGSGLLTRIQTTPCGSETTSPYFYPDINGYSYLMSVIQQSFGESDQDALQVDEIALYLASRARQCLLSGRHLKERRPPHPFPH